MTIRGLLIIFGVSLASSMARGDDLVYRYEGDVPPNPDAGWLGGGCEDTCQESLEDGHLVLRWTAGQFVTYGYRIATPETRPPPDPPFWVESRFRSNHLLGNNPVCDGSFTVQYRGYFDYVNIFGDVVISSDWGDVFRYTRVDEFRTYRFESLDGERGCFYVDGELFSCRSGGGGNGYSTILMMGEGGCDLDQFPTVNEWDFVRFGTIAYGETMVSSDPPSGFVDARQHAPLDRFTVTFDSPNYVFIDEITVDVTDGSAPLVTKTRRLDNGDPETVEIVLDQPIPYGATTTFTFDDGVAVNVIEFTFAPGDTDGDGDADLHDFATFQTCFGHEPVTGPCPALDAVTDDTIDLADYAEFAISLHGPAP